MAGAPRSPEKRTFSHHLLGRADAIVRKQMAAQHCSKSGELHDGDAVMNDSGVPKQEPGSVNKKEAGVIQGVPKRSATRRALDRFIACF